MHAALTSSTTIMNSRNCPWKNSIALPTAEHLALQCDVARVEQLWDVALAALLTEVNPVGEVGQLVALVAVGVVPHDMGELVGEQLDGRDERCKVGGDTELGGDVAVVERRHRGRVQDHADSLACGIPD